MASERGASLHSLAAPALFLAGAGAAVAAPYGLWASAAVCLIMAGLAGAAMIEKGRRAASADSPRAGVQDAARKAATLGAILDHAPAPLLAWESGGGLRAVNRAARRLFGVQDLILAAPVELVAAISAAEPGGLAKAEFAWAGRPRAYALSIADLIDGSRSLRLAALTDVQSELRAAEAAALRELVSVLSHEIMNSLTPITSLAETARETLANAERGDDLETAREAIETLARRTTGLLVFVEGYRKIARVPEPRREPVRLEALLNEAERLFLGRWAARGVKLTAAPWEGRRVDIDPALVMQALINLLANAAEAALERTNEPQVWFAARLDDEARLFLTVEDNGPGLGDHDPDTLFRAFFTTKPEGTGVGLSLARQIARAHGGDLTCGSSSHGGATFQLELPAAGISNLNPPWEAASPGKARA